MFGRVNHQALGPLISKAKKGKLYGLRPDNNKGKIYISNGQVDRFVYPSESIPDGWYRGRKREQKRRRKPNVLVVD